MKEVGHFKKCCPMTASQSGSQVAVKHKEPKREMGPHDLSILRSEQVLPDHSSIGLVTGSKRRWPIQSVSPKRVKDFPMFSPITTIQSLKTCHNTCIIMFMTDEEKPHQVKY